MRVVIHGDKKTNTLLTGRTLAFERYAAELEKVHARFDLHGRRPIYINGVAVVYYAYAAADREVIGVYLHDGDWRVIVECAAAKDFLAVHDMEFKQLLQSLRRTAQGPQRYIDFPLPDTGERDATIKDPAAAKRVVADWVRRGDLYAHQRDVQLDCLAKAVRAYGEAMRIEMTLPEAEAQPEWEALAQKLRGMTSEYQDAISDLQFAFEQNLKMGQISKAREIARQLDQMVPDKEDPLYREVSAAVTAMLSKGNVR